MKKVYISAILLLTASLTSALKANTAYLKYKLRAPQDSFIETAGVSGTLATTIEPYCYYSFKDRKYKRCLDGDSSSLESRSCTSGKDEVWQLIPYDPDKIDNEYYYFKNKEHNNYIKMKEGGKIQMTNNISEATEIEYYGRTWNGNTYYALVSGDLADSPHVYERRVLKAKKKVKQRYKIRAAIYENDYDNRETWHMFKQTDACVA